MVVRPVAEADCGAPAIVSPRRAPGTPFTPRFLGVGLERDQVETQLPSLASAPASARAFLREALRTWALDGLGETVELLTGELVSNVVRHVDAPMTLRAIVGPSAVRVEVADPSPVPPVAPPTDLLAQRGRGLMLVDALASRWGTELTTSGKTVWFEIDKGTMT